MQQPVHKRTTNLAAMTRWARVESPKPLSSESNMNGSCFSQSLSMPFVARRRRLHAFSSSASRRLSSPPQIPWPTTRYTVDDGAASVSAVSRARVSVSVYAPGLEARSKVRISAANNVYPSSSLAEAGNGHACRRRERRSASFVLPASTFARVNGKTKDGGAKTNRANRLGYSIVRIRNKQHAIH